jgi:hypothetical protein
MTAPRTKHRVLVVVTGTVTTTAAERLLATHRYDELIVLAPVLVGRLRFWATDSRTDRQAEGQPFEPSTVHQKEGPANAGLFCAPELRECWRDGLCGKNLEKPRGLRYASC